MSTDVVEAVVRVDGGVKFTAGPSAKYDDLILSELAKGGSAR
jgi:hypothetical protein